MLSLNMGMIKNNGVLYSNIKVIILLANPCSKAHCKVVQRRNSSQFAFISKSKTSQRGRFSPTVCFVIL